MTQYSYDVEEILLEQLRRANEQWRRFKFGAFIALGIAMLTACAVLG